MRTSPIFAVLALSVVAENAGAQFASEDSDNPTYVQFTLGPSFLNENTPDWLVSDETVFGQGTGWDTGLAVSALLGRDVAKTGDMTWSLEGEAFYTFMKMEPKYQDNFPTTNQDTFSAFALMANVMVDVPLTKEVSFYLGGGGGYATNIKMETFDDGNLDQKDNNKLAGQAKFGFRWNLGNRYDVSLGYRYFRTEDVEIEDVVSGSTDDVKFEDQVIEIGMRWAW